MKKLISILLSFLFVFSLSACNKEKDIVYNKENSVQIEHLYSKLQSDYKLSSSEKNNIELKIIEKYKTARASCWLVFDTDDWETAYKGLKYAMQQLSPLTDYDYLDCMTSIWLKYDNKYVVHNGSYNYYKDTPSEFYLSQNEFSNDALKHGFKTICSEYEVGNYEHNDNEPDFIHPMLKIRFPRKGECDAIAEIHLEKDYTNTELTKLGEDIQELFKEAVQTTKNYIIIDYDISLHCPNYSIVGRTKHNSNVIVWEKEEN